MYPRRPTRSLLLTAACLAAVASAAGCAATDQPTWTEPPAGHVLPGPVTAAQPVTVRPVSGARALTRPAVASGSTAMAGMTASAASAAGTGVSQAVDRVDITIVTGDMIGKTEYPAYIPSDIVLPAYSTVVVTITNFDDATPLAKGTEQYAKADGIAGGTFSVTPIDLKNPNGSAGATKTLSSLDPNDVSHTLTAPGLGLNVPIAPHARETFTITTGAPGTYTWHCFDPCGAGATGWGTAMSAMHGYMEGTIVVA